jgi:hypothetical protein
MNDEIINEKISEQETTLLTQRYATTDMVVLVGPALVPLIRLDKIEAQTERGLCASESKPRYP